MDWFSGANTKLEAAIDRDDIAALRSAVQSGANVNARGKAGVTPLEYAVGHGKKQTYLELLKMHANPNQRDEEKDNAMTLAVDAFPKDKDYLTAALQSGGDPNTIQSNGDSILGTFEGRHDLEGIRVLAKAGANLNALKRGDGDPLLINAAFANDWDVVWLLLQLGAKYDYQTGPNSIQKVFLNPAATPPSSPLHEAKKKSWEFLSQHGVKLPPLD